MSFCYVIGAMPVDSLPLTPAAADLVIAADGGAAACAALGVKPDLIVGDFDSLGYTPKGDNVVTVPVEKDDTDMALAVRLGRERGYRSFLLLGGTGGRPDHTLANYALLARLAQAGCRGVLLDRDWAAFAITGTAVNLPASCRGTVSVFAMDTLCRGVYERGLKYSLTNAELYAAVALGVSNSFTGRSAHIRVETGTLLIILEAAAAQQALGALLEVPT